MNLNSNNNKFWEDNNEFIGDSGSGGVVDAILSTTSTNPVQNKAITDKINSISSDVSGLADRFKIVGTGSVYDIKKTGLYYLTGAVTDKPEVTGSSRGGLIVMKWSAGVQSYVQYVFFQGIQNGEVWKCLIYQNGDNVTNYGWEKLYPLS